LDSVRFGIIGAGRIAHLVSWVFQEDPLLRAVAVADVQREAAAQLAAELAVADVYTDYRTMLERQDIDAVYIATPPFLHRSMVLAALAADKHVLCEKPFVLRQEEVQEIETAAAAKPSLKVGCCSCRFHAAPTARRARQMVTGGELGVVYRLWFEAISRAWPVGAQLPPWRNDPARNGGGIAFDWGVYDLDWIAEVLGDGFRPRTVFGTLGNYFPLSEQRRPPTPDVDGRLAAEIVCDGGLTVHWERRAAEHGPPRHRVEIRGTRGGLDLSMTPEGKETRLLRHAYRVDEELSSETLPEEPADWRQTLVYPLRDMAAAIRDDRPPASPLRRQRVIHAVLDALYASAATRSAITVELPPVSAEQTTA
jgi:predicted dehydrogenase